MHKAQSTSYYQEVTEEIRQEKKVEERKWDTQKDITSDIKLIFSPTIDTVTIKGIWLDEIMKEEWRLLRQLPPKNRELLQPYNEKL